MNFYEFNLRKVMWKEYKIPALSCYVKIKWCAQSDMYAMWDTKSSRSF